MKRDWTADFIKLAAVATAIPRWVAALLLAEGLAVPADWVWWWLPFAALLNAGMALTEGLAFAYIFGAWKRAEGKESARLFALACLSAVAFVGILAPYVAASATGSTLAAMLAQPWATWVWGVCVAGSTMVIVAGVGYAQKHGDGTDLQGEVDTMSTQVAQLNTELAQSRQAATDAQQAVTAWAMLTQTERAGLMKGALAGRNGDGPAAAEIARALKVSTSTVTRAKVRREVKA